MCLQAKSGLTNWRDKFRDATVKEYGGEKLGHKVENETEVESNF